MADGTAPTIDKVDPPAPGAQEEKAQAPTLPIHNGAPAFQHAELNKKLEVNTSDAPNAIPDGAGPAVSYPAPKPVEVMSVPETPANGTTPLGQSPRPELNIPAENTFAPALSSNGQMNETKATEEGSSVPKPDPADAPASEERVANGTETTAGTEKLDGSTIPPDSSILKVNGSEGAIAQSNPPGSMTKDEAPVDEKMATESKPPATNVLPLNEPAPGGKRKLDDHANGDSTAGIEKKPKLAPNAVNTSQPTKANKPKKNIVKKALASVMGRTQRKTRSQGPVDGSL